MHNYPKFFKIVLMMVCLCFLCPAISFAAETGKNMIEPFMAAPFGASREQIIEAEGGTGLDEKGWLYEKNFMGIPVRVSHLIGYGSNKSEARLYLVTVNFTKNCSTLAEMEQICADITDMVKAQMQNPNVINRQYKRTAFKDGRTGEVYVIKAYLKDENILAALVFWWDEAEKSLKAKFTFNYYKISKLFTELFFDIFDPSPVDGFLASEQKPTFIKYNWAMSRSDFRHIMGPEFSSYEDWFYKSDSYKDMVFGVPAEVTAIFRRANSFSSSELASLMISSYMSCPSLEQAEAVTKKIVDFVSAEIAVSQGIGFSLVMGNDAGESTWRSWSAFITSDKYISLSTEWDEEYEGLVILMFHEKGTMSDNDYKRYFEGWDKENLRVFYRVNRD